MDSTESKETIMLTSFFWTDSNQTAVTFIADSTNYGGPEDYAAALQALPVWTATTPPGANFAYAVALDPAWADTNGATFIQAAGSTTAFAGVGVPQVSLQSVLNPPS
jgi:hypothetical protein